jgi:hypothetical protein
MTQEDHKSVLKNHLWKVSIDHKQRNKQIGPDYKNSYKMGITQDNKYYSLLRDITLPADCH